MIKSIEIGRDPQSDICVDGRFDTVSNKHATIDYDGESLIFIDHIKFYLCNLKNDSSKLIKTLDYKKVLIKNYYFVKQYMIFIVQMVQSLMVNVLKICK